MRFAVFLPFFLLLAGCYSDPNIPADKRVQFPGDDVPTAGVVSGTHTPAVAGTGTPTVVNPGLPPVEAGVGEGSAAVAVGDTLTVSFSDAPPGAFSPPQIIVKVGTEGTITLPYNVTVQALGKTPTELEREIRSAYVPKLFVNCTPNVKAEDRFFFVGGEVRAPSRQAYTSHSMTVLRAITSAGGFTDFAKKSKIEVRRANGGKTEYVNYEKARKDPKLDLPIFPNDQIIVPRGL
ncbi:MAG: polysaccharide biosynthesis/export protein VpsN [Verrucomicrobiota bacterium]|jgi:polysaccharide export outer membrane protein